MNTIGIWVYLKKKKKEQPTEAGASFLKELPD